eukprot:SAG22_NODE_2155_length_2920_cov_51.291741_1_plen_118_part_00
MAAQPTVYHGASRADCPVMMKLALQLLLLLLNVAPAAAPPPWQQIPATEAPQPPYPNRARLVGLLASSADWILDHNRSGVCLRHNLLRPCAAGAVRPAPCARRRLGRARATTTGATT